MDHGKWKMGVLTLVWPDADDLNSFFESYSIRVAELGDVERTFTYNDKGCPI